jgi:hypothetical protein
LVSPRTSNDQPTSTSGRAGPAGRDILTDGHVVVVEPVEIATV